MRRGHMCVFRVFWQLISRLKAITTVMRARVQHWCFVSPLLNQCLICTHSQYKHKYRIYDQRCKCHFLAKTARNKDTFCTKKRTCALYQHSNLIEPDWAKSMLCFSPFGLHHPTLVDFLEAEISFYVPLILYVKMSGIFSAFVVFLSKFDKKTPRRVI